MPTFRYSMGIAVARHPRYWCWRPKWRAERESWPRIYTFQWLFLYVAMAKGIDGD